MSPTLASLVVQHLDFKVGELRRTADLGLRFHYDESWLTNPRRFALAASLPLTSETFDGGFFRNLLPEAHTRERIARALGISAENDFEFLRLFGEDCAGAFSIVDPERTSDPVSQPFLTLEPIDYELLSKPDGFGSLFRSEPRPRLSLAGAQNKLGVIELANGKMAVPLDGRPTTHILKLPNSNYRGLVENEALMLRLAKHLGLPSVEIRIVESFGFRALLVTRYDRVETEQGLERLHQQDFCQALGLPPEMKYEREGGPSLVECLDLIRNTVVNPLSDAATLIRWSIFNVLIHNADAHAKNLSLLRQPNGTQHLAPFYDLLCTGSYPKLDHRLAMKVGGQEDPGILEAKHWNRFAEDLRVGPHWIKSQAAELASQLQNSLPEQMDRLESEIGRMPRRQQILRTIQKKCQKTSTL